MVLWMVAIGVVPYLKDGLNAFDALIVVVSMVEVFVNPPTFRIGGRTPSGSVTALRALRLLRCQPQCA